MKDDEKKNISQLSPRMQEELDCSDNCNENEYEEEDDEDYQK